MKQTYIGDRSKILIVEMQEDPVFHYGVSIAQLIKCSLRVHCVLDTDDTKMTKTVPLSKKPQSIEKNTQKSNTRW